MQQMILLDDGRYILLDGTGVSVMVGDAQVQDIIDIADTNIGRADFQIAVENPLEWVIEPKEDIKSGEVAVELSAKLS